MAVSDDLKALRDETGVSIMQCKKALEEAGGDIEKAKVILRKASAAIATKKADRELGAGVASAYVHAGGSVVGAIVLAC
jgi:elongation factor Ts